MSQNLDSQDFLNKISHCPTPWLVNHINEKLLEKQQQIEAHGMTGIQFAEGRQWFQWMIWELTALKATVKQEPDEDSKPPAKDEECNMCDNGLPLKLCEHSAPIVGHLDDLTFLTSHQRLPKNQTLLLNPTLPLMLWFLLKIGERHGCIGFTECAGATNHCCYLQCSACFIAHGTTQTVFSVKTCVDSCTGINLGDYSFHAALAWLCPKVVAQFVDLTAEQ